MSIKRISVTNFKSFGELELELGKLNVLIGANASGKSNFVQLFGFLRDIANHGLDNAVSMQGGVEYLRNINIGSSTNLSVEVVFEPEYCTDLTIKYINKILAKTHEVCYKIDISFGKENSGFSICEDQIIEKCKFFKSEKDIGEGEITFSNIDGKVWQEFKNFPDEVVSEIEDYRRVVLREDFYSKSLLQTQFSNLLCRNIEGISIYDFNPKSIRTSNSIIGKAELEENGNNLTLVLKNIIGNEEKKRKFFNLIKYLLDFVEDLGIEKSSDKTLFLKLQELYSNQYLPVFSISDGTISIIALIVALYFEEKSLAIIEEPERNIHPYLISKVVEMMQDASRNKQIIITTHNPEIVKYADLEDILLISRDKEGFSFISKPAEKKEVKIFLENEIGIDDLYVRNLLGV